MGWENTPSVPCPQNSCKKAEVPAYRGGKFHVPPYFLLIIYFWGTSILCHSSPYAPRLSKTPHMFTHNWDSGQSSNEGPACFHTTVTGSINPPGVSKQISRMFGSNPLNHPNQKTPKIYNSPEQPPWTPPTLLQVKPPKSIFLAEPISPFAWVPQACSSWKINPIKHAKCQKACWNKYGHSVYSVQNII